MSSRPRFALAVPFVAIAVLATACSGGSSSHKATTTIPNASGKPNIVFVLADDLDLREVSYLPSVRRLIAERGMTLDNYFISNSLCCPSRTTMLRGEYAHDTGVESNSGPNGGFDAAFSHGDTSQTIGNWMQSAG